MKSQEKCEANVQFATSKHLVRMHVIGNDLGENLPHVRMS